MVENSKVNVKLSDAREKMKLRNAFNNNISTDLTHFKAQISKVIQSGGILGSLLSKLAGTLMKVAIRLAKSVFAPLGITAAASAIEAGIQKKTTTLIILNKKMNDIMEIVEALEDSNVLLKEVSKIIKNKTKEQKGGFLSMMLGNWGASLLGKRNVRAELLQKRKRDCKSWLWKRMGFLIPPHPLQKYYESKPRFNWVFSRDNLPKKIKDLTHLTNLDEYADAGTHWIALFFNRSKIVYFSSFGVEHVSEEIEKFVGNKNVIANIFRAQANNSAMCGYFCIEFIDFMLAGKKLTDLTSMFSLYDFKKNDKIILSYFRDKWN